MHTYMHAPPPPILPQAQRDKTGTKHWKSTAQAHQTRVHGYHIWSSSAALCSLFLPLPHSTGESQRMGTPRRRVARWTPGPPEGPELGAEELSDHWCPKPMPAANAFLFNAPCLHPRFAASQEVCWRISQMFAHFYANFPGVCKNILGAGRDFCDMGIKIAGPVLTLCGHAEGMANDGNMLTGRCWKQLRPSVAPH